MKKYAVLDIGGTTIKYGCVTENGHFLLKGTRPTLAREEGSEGIVRKVVEIVDTIGRQGVLSGVAIDSAGIVKPGFAGEIIFAGEASFPGYSGTKLASRVTEATGLPCYLENDVNAAALGEYWQGAAQGAASVFMATVGTGLGGCFLLDGRVWHGARYSAGELGFLRLHGEKRILEDLASTRALIREVSFTHNVSPAELSGEQIFLWAKQGDEDALLAIRDMAAAITEGLSAVCCLLNPEVIVLGGGVMAQQELLQPFIEQQLDTLVMPAMRAGTRLTFAGLGNDAGMLGALYAFLQADASRL